MKENRLAELAPVDGRKWRPGGMLTRRGDQNAHRKVYHQYQLVLIKFYIDEHGIIPGPPWSEISMNRLRYGKALTKTIINQNFQTFFLYSTQIHNGGATDNVGASLSEALREIFEPE